MSHLGLGRVKTKSDLIVMPSGRQIFAFFCSPHDRRAQNSGCDYTPQSFYTARVNRDRNPMSALRPFTPCAFNRSVQHRLQSIGRRLEAQGLSRTLIEPQSNCVQITLRDAREIGSSREVLPQQAVGVLV